MTPDGTAAAGLAGLPPPHAADGPVAPLQDRHGRVVDYLRLSVTDRCNFRCVYCMAETPRFLPKAEILTLEELDRLCGTFIRLGVRRLRLTGGEPLVRHGVMALIDRLGRRLTGGGLEELTLTTNGSLLNRCAVGLAAAGVRRINVSLDTLDPDRFRAITRIGSLDRVLSGLAAARDAGLAVKINCVALKDTGPAELDRLVGWCGTQGFDLTLIEVMPLGEPDAAARRAQSQQMSAVRRHLLARWTLEPDDYRSAGPARYMRCRETGRRIGFIAPVTEGFCAGCNRVRVTCTGRLALCLGHDDAADLRPALRCGDGRLLEAAIRAAVLRKPRGHDFALMTAAAGAGPALSPRRGMNVTGG